LPGKGQGAGLCREISGFCCNEGDAGIGLGMQVDAIRKFVCPEIVEGLDSRKLVHRYALNMGLSRVMLVSDEGLCQAGWTGEVEQILSSNGIEVVPFYKLTPNPKDYEVHEGAELYQQSRCDGIITVGGGSATDCGKGIGIIVSNWGNIRQYEGVDKISRPIPPQISIPTTCGTSADLSQFALIVDSERKSKMTIVSKALVPDLSIIDPRTLTTLDAYQTACTGLDALSHAIEAFVSNAHSSLSDLNAQSAMVLVHKNLLEALKHPERLEPRIALMQGSMQAGLAFSNASLGATHAMSHSLGGVYDLTHGECNSILLNRVINFNYDAEELRFKKVCELLNIEVAGLNNRQIREALSREFLAFRKAAGIASSLRDKGVHEDDFNMLSTYAMHDACIVTNPRKPTKDDLKAIYAECF